MKKIFIVTGALFFCSFLSAKNLEHNPFTDSFITESINSNKVETMPFLNLNDINDKSSDTSLTKVDCTIRITGTFDGVEVDLEITIHEVTWVGCKLLQAGIRALE